MIGSQEWLVNYTANKTRAEEIAFRQEEINSSISDILARDKQKENQAKLMKEIRE
jgi:hypothetical protein